MKKQINPSIKAHLLPSLFILLSLLAIGGDPICPGAATNSQACRWPVTGSRFRRRHKRRRSVWCVGAKYDREQHRRRRK